MSSLIIYFLRQITIKGFSSNFELKTSYWDQHQWTIYGQYETGFIWQCDVDILWNSFAIIPMFKSALILNLSEIISLARCLPLYRIQDLWSLYITHQWCGQRQWSRVHGVVSLASDEWLAGYARSADASSATWLFSGLCPFPTRTYFPSDAQLWCGCITLECRRRIFSESQGTGRWPHCRGILRLPIGGEGDCMAGVLTNLKRCLDTTIIGRIFRERL